MFITYDEEHDTVTVAFQNTVSSSTDVIRINADTTMVVDSRQQPVLIQISNARANTSHPWQVTASISTKHTPKTYIGLPPRPDVLDDPTNGLDDAD